MLASGVLDDDAAARLSAQLLTLDAEGRAAHPARSCRISAAELPAALTIMGILDVLRAAVSRLVGAARSAVRALGVLASCPRRSRYPNASFLLTEPRLRVWRHGNRASPRGSSS